MYFVLIIIITLKLSCCVKAIENHGPYQILWKDYTMCHNSIDMRPNNTTFFTTMKENKPHPTFYFNLTILTPTKLNAVKIVAYLKKEDRKTLIHNQNLDNPCKSYTWFKLVQIFLNISKNCVIATGSYVFDINFNEYAKKLIGDNFFYGEYLTKVVLLSNKKYLVCTIIESEISKAVKTV